MVKIFIRAQPRARALLAGIKFSETFLTEWHPTNNNHFEDTPREAAATPCRLSPPFDRVQAILGAISTDVGACRIVGAGRNREALSKLRELGADATIQLDQPEDELKKSFTREAGKEGFNVVIDYVWAGPALYPHTGEATANQQFARHYRFLSTFLLAGSEDCD